MRHDADAWLSDSVSVTVARENQSSWTRYLLGGLPGFGALNAFGRGFYGPSGAEGVPLELLEGSPFGSYFIPSLILLAVVVGSVAGLLVLLLAALLPGKVATRPRRGLRRELLRWRDLVAALHIAPGLEPEAHAAAFRAMLRFTPAASKQIPCLRA